MDTKTFTDILARRCALPKEKVQAVVEALGDAVTRHCADFDPVAIPGFGTFEARKRAERVTVHPATGQKLLVPPKITVAFKPSALLKQKLKDSLSEPEETKI